MSKSTDCKICQGSNPSLCSSIHEDLITMPNQPDELDKIMWDLGAAVEEGRCHDADLRKAKAAIRAYNARETKEAIAEIKDLMRELIDKLERKVYANKDSTIEGHSGFGTESAAMMVWIRELRQEVNEL